MTRLLFSRSPLRSHRRADRRMTRARRRNLRLEQLDARLVLSGIPEILADATVVTDVAVPPAAAAVVAVADTEQATASAPSPSATVTLDQQGMLHVSAN